MAQTTPNILVVEDDRETRTLIAKYLRANACNVMTANDGREMFRAMADHRVDLVILDVMLPGEDGLSLCRKVQEQSQTPTIMLTARGEDVDRILGLEMGADDYISKPFSPNELVARVRALMRRSKRTESSKPTLVFKSLTMDLTRHIVVDSGTEVKLTAKEFMLLQYLLEHRGRVLSRDLLLGDVWGYKYTGGTRTVDVHVRRLREKLPVLVEGLVTVKQFGYKLVEESS